MRLVGEDAVVGMAGYNADRHCTKYAETRARSSVAFGGSMTCPDPTKVSISKALRAAFDVRI
jgi:hypothetical protein